jgi:serine/threonine-protein kinase
MTDQARRSPVRVGRIGDIVGGKYRVERVVGAGGMGVVVAAVHLELGQRVALKFILPDAMAGRDAVERFFREARAIARLNSEHITRVFDVSRADEENPYMVLELLEGEDLAHLHRSKGPLSVGDAVEYLLQACAGLVDAHAAGIIHRDLKPQNLFVTRRPNGAPLVKLLDFGIAKAVGAAAVGQITLTDSKAVIGSPLYMPPEQMRSARIADVRSDIWSMGVMLYELLGGKLPFDGETVTEICVRVVNEAPTPLLTLRPSLDPKLAETVMRCLEKNPDRRWPNVAQLGAALEPYAKSTLLGGPVRPWKSLEMTGISSDVGPISSAPVGTQLLAPTPVSVPPLRMAQTDTTWDDHARDTSKPSFAKGIAVGVAVSLFAIGGAVAILAPRFKTTPPPPVPAVVESVASAPEPPPPPPPPAPAISAEPSKPATGTSPKKRRPAIVAPAPVPASAEPPKAEPAKTAEPSPNGAPILR